MPTEHYKTLKEISGNSFNIESYQRGYRWDEKNVTELLDDIFEGKMPGDHFDKLGINTFPSPSKALFELKTLINNNNLNSKYCLQPLVVKKTNSSAKDNLNDTDKDNTNNKKTYNVIDGQQRLTTLIIIFAALDKISGKDALNNPDFNITYSAKSDLSEYIKKINDSQSDDMQDNIDAAYMKQAYEVAKKWFEKKNENFVSLLEDPKRDDSKLDGGFAEHISDILLEETVFIWDEIEDESEEKEQKVFADRNSGKIELTDAELIKALFMDPENYGDEEPGLKDKQILISELWDVYENNLHNEELWKFMPIGQKERQELKSLTRMDAVFMLLMRGQGGADVYENHKYEDNALFKIVKEWLDKKLKERKEGETKADIMARCWRDVCGVIDGITELFNNNEIYNLLSLYKKVEEPDGNIYENYELVRSSKKSERPGVAKKLISNILFKDNIKDTVLKIRYPDRVKIRKVLLAYNVALTNNSKPAPRFMFDYFYNEKNEWLDWEIEHIFARKEKLLKKAGIDKRAEALRLIIADQNKDGGQGVTAHREYVEMLHDINMDEVLKDNDEKTIKNDYFNRYKIQDGDLKKRSFDIWRYLQLKESAVELLEKYELYTDISETLNTDDSDTQMPDISETPKKDDGINEKIAKFFSKHIKDLDDKFLNQEYLWDDEIEREYYRIKESGETPDAIKWHGYYAKIKNAQVAWTRELDRTEDDLNGFKNLFKRYFQEDLVGALYDNKDIDNIGIGNHGEKLDEESIKENVGMLKGLLEGRKYCIEKEFDDFFESIANENSTSTEDYDENADNVGEIDIEDIEKDLATNQKDYTKWLILVGDNSMGNLMLLPEYMNISISNGSLNEKRNSFVKNDGVFLPPGSLHVLMGKFNEIDVANEQWLMKERKKYLEDIINKLTGYYGEVKNEQET